MQATAQMYNNGRITIPIQIRKALNLLDGENVTFQLEDGEVKLLTVQQQLDNARKILNQLPQWEKFTVDDFIQERRLEAKREMEEYEDPRKLCTMSIAVLDSSVIIAILKNEPGACDSHLCNGLVSTVNLVEVATRLITLGCSEDQATTIMSELPVKAIDFTKELVNTTAFLMGKTKRYGLSLGDRACLATAMMHNLPVLTADRIWKELAQELKLEIQLIQ